MKKREKIERIQAIEEEFPFPEPQIKRLEQRKWILNQVARIPESIGAEIGVFRGHFSELISKIVKPKKLYLVDPWEKSGPTFGWGAAYTNNDTLLTKVAKEESQLRAELGAVGEVVMVEEYFPVENGVFSEKLDWIYLDASHQYERTIKELRAIPDYLKDDGVIIGDDWDPRPEAKHHSVFLAIWDFCAESDWRVVAAGPGQQWCLRRFAKNNADGEVR